MPEKQHHGTVTTLLQQMQDGCDGAENKLMELVYGELRAVAGRFMANVPPSDTLQPTALVNEAYLKMIGDAEVNWQNRRHFFSVAARAMHDIIVDQARRHAAIKRGGDRKRLSLDCTEIEIKTQALELLDLSKALLKLQDADPLAAEVVMLRFFSGLTYEQIALALDLAKMKVRREWQYARAFLQQALDADETES